MILSGAITCFLNDVIPALACLLSRAIDTVIGPVPDLSTGHDWQIAAELAVSPGWQRRGGCFRATIGH